MIKPTPITTDPKEQAMILADARRQTAALGLNTVFAFNKNGELLIDGRTHREIDASYEINLAHLRLSGGLTADGRPAPVPTEETMNKIKWIRPAVTRFHEYEPNVLEFKRR